MTSSMSDFNVILQFLATASAIKCTETLDFHRICVLIGSTTLPSLMCNRFELLNYDVIIVEKVLFPVLGLFKMTDC